MATATTTTICRSDSSHAAAAIGKTASALTVTWPGIFRSAMKTATRPSRHATAVTIDWRVFEVVESRVIGEIMKVVLIAGLLRGVRHERRRQNYAPTPSPTMYGEH